MPIVREQVCPPERYHGRLLTACHMGPDVLGYVDGIELGGFFMSPHAAIAAGRRYVDDQIKSEAKARAG